MSNDNDLKNKYGVDNHFKVPEDYFEKFSKELMDKLPEKREVIDKPTVTMWQRIKPLVYLAAMFCGMMICFNTFIDKPQKQKTVISSTEMPNFTDEEAEVIMDNSMMDDYTLYTYISDND